MGFLSLRRSFRAFADSGISQTNFVSEQVHALPQGKRQSSGMTSFFLMVVFTCMLLAIAGHH